MRESAMMRKTERRALHPRENIQVRCFGGERECERGERRLAIQPGAPQARPGQEVSNRFQARMSILHAREARVGTAPWAVDANARLSVRNENSNSPTKNLPDQWVRLYADIAAFTSTASAKSKRPAQP